MEGARAWREAQGMCRAPEQISGAHKACLRRWEEAGGKADASESNETDGWKSLN